MAHGGDTRAPLAAVALVVALSATARLASAQPEPAAPPPATEPGSGRAAGAAPEPTAPPAKAGDEAGDPTPPDAAAPAKGPEAKAADAKAAPAADARAAEAAPAEAAPGKTFWDGFAFGSYGRVIAASDAAGRPGRDADVVAHGSRLDLDNYAELELRREDHWESLGATSRLVATLALGNSIFHYSGDFDAAFAIRNLYLEETGLGLEDFSIWAGSRMVRGDDIYLCDFWPLDNVNSLGGGVRYAAPTHTTASLHMGMAQPQNPFYRQAASRPAPLNQFGAATVDVLDRQRWLGALRLEQLVLLGPEPDKAAAPPPRAGLKFVVYGEAQHVPAAQRETATPDVFEDVPADRGFVVGAQIGAFTGERDTHLNLFVRYATGLAAYGEFAAPEALALDRTAAGAHEVVVAMGGNWEISVFALTLGAYFRSFRNASEPLDFGDVDEGIFILRPHVFFAEWAGVAVEGSYQALARGILTPDRGPDDAPHPLTAHVGRIGVMPFVQPAGPGAFSRPRIHLEYAATFRDKSARLLYPTDDPFSLRSVDHFFGLGAEWWFGSTSYGGT
ncbi:MAG: carbohydrate porin [Myxococcales bacterium]|nr:carbohydrate porin [Myxococcales bacterium]